MTPPFSKGKGFQKRIKKWLHIVIVENGGNGGREGLKLENAGDVNYGKPSKPPPQQQV